MALDLQNEHAAHTTHHCGRDILHAAEEGGRGLENVSVAAG